MPYDEHPPPFVEALAEAITPDWPQISAVWESFRRHYDFRLRSDTGENDVLGFLKDAVSVAYGRGRLRALALELEKQGLIGDVFKAQLASLIGEVRVQLHAFQNGVFAPKSALVAGKRMLVACEHVCRIDIWNPGNNRFEQVGTGVLVKPTIVATAAHVVAGLITENPDRSITALPGSVGNLQLVFRDVEDFLPDGDEVARGPGEPAPLHERWLAWASLPTTNERDRALFDINNIDGIEVPGGPWDLALIRLAKPRRDFRVLEILETDPPTREFPVHVLHHPNGGMVLGQPLLWSIGVLDPRRLNPPVRCLHNANTAGGSSGAPVFDAEWRVVALHQAGEELSATGAAAATGYNGSPQNRAVPVQHWSRDLARIEAEADDAPYLSVLDDIPNQPPHPVIGRRATQRRIWSALQGGATIPERLQIVRGQPGMGRHFTLRLVRALAASCGGLAVELDARNAQDDDAAAFAARILGAFASIAGLGEPTGLTTLEREIRKRNGPDLAAEMSRIAGDRIVWLCLDGLDEARLDVHNGVPELVHALIGALASNPQLRLVLVGWLAPVPDGFSGAVENLVPPTVEDVKDYLLLRYAPPGSTIDPDTVEGIAKLVQGLLRSVNLAAPDAYPRLIEALRPIEATFSALLQAQIHVQEAM